jgi:hypothetical protein
VPRTRSDGRRRDASRIGTLPPVGALDRLRAANGDEGLVGRARSSPRLLVGIVGGALLLLAWIGWAVYVTSDHGARAGLGVVIAWPAMLGALAIISLPFIGAYLLIRRLSDSEGGGTATAEAESSDADDEPEDSAEDDDPDDESEEEEGSEEDEEDEGEEDEEEEPDEEDSSKS